MIDNPLPDQVMQEKETLYVNEQFEEHCANTAKEIAKDNNLNPDDYQHLKDLSRAGLSIGFLIREAIHDFVIKTKK